MVRGFLRWLAISKEMVGMFCGVWSWKRLFGCGRAEACSLVLLSETL